LPANTPTGLVRVLMADDDPTVSAFIRKVLPASRFLVDVAEQRRGVPAHPAYSAERVRHPVARPDDA